ncbi:MAG: hypothetical protein EXQ91_04045 [Alphaproteobacteria bacterium]|nr:hypothetical protein [Alphaproteobacteria bacterium]
MQPLKVVVILLGVLILIGFGAMIGVIAERLVAGERIAKANPVLALAALALPKGARVVETVAAGDRLILRVAREGAADELIIYDLALGRALGTIALTEAP